jgi:hypothetical protein
MDEHQDRPAVWIVGDWRHADFAIALLWLQEQAVCRRFARPGEALEAADAAIWAPGGRAPGAILFLQPRPGQIAAEAVEALHQRFPLARLAALVGPWCEGELRSGPAWPGVTRVPWRNWQSRLASELGLAPSHGAPTCGAPSCGERLPRTASDSERLLRSLERLKRRVPGLLAIVCTGNRDRFEPIRDCLRLLGVRSLWQWPCVPVEKGAVDLVFVDGWENWPAAAYGVSREEAAATRPPHVLLLDFPRPDDLARAEALGAAATIAEPMLLADLAWALEAVLPATDDARRPLIA